MGGGKEDEKIIRPLFPRLHVNDAEKGGPRAPPRNKMALYEQFSVPSSQRFHAGISPRNPTSSSLVPLTSSNQVSNSERNVCYPLHMPTSMPIPAVENFDVCESAGPSMSYQTTQLKQRNNTGNEDDFVVPVFVQSGTDYGKSQTSKHNENFMPSRPKYISPTKTNTDLKQSGSLGPDQRHKMRSQGIKDPKRSLLGKRSSMENPDNLSTSESFDKMSNITQVSQDTCAREPLVLDVRRLHDRDTCSRQGNRAQSEKQFSARNSDKSMGGNEQEDVSRPANDSCSGEVPRLSAEPASDCDHAKEKAWGSLPKAVAERDDDVSEASIIDPVSVMDITPDDVVGIIGQKHFWKARRAIAVQQRVFAVQVFELHRLIKVQKLIAKSPHLLLEDASLLDKPSPKLSPAENVAEERDVNSSQPKHKDVHQNPSHQMECSAENAVGKPVVSSIKNGSHPSKYSSYMGKTSSAPMASDSRISPWGFHQSMGCQLLVPVMSPSEGLVYKPYPAPGPKGVVCGGCGPYGTMPMMANYMNPTYGVPIPIPQGMGFVPGVPPAGHSYCTTFGMPVMNFAGSGSAVDQTSGSHCQTVNVTNESSCNVPEGKSEAIAPVQFQLSKEKELQGSTASSPSEKPDGLGTACSVDGKDALQLFPTAPAVAEDCFQPNSSDQPTKVIRVVPHNARSATESAARIFKSIQEERKNYDTT